MSQFGRRIYSRINILRKQKSDLLVLQPLFQSEFHSSIRFQKLHPLDSAPHQKWHSKSYFHFSHSLATRSASRIWNDDENFFSKPVYSVHATPDKRRTRIFRLANHIHSTGDLSERFSTKYCQLLLYFYATNTDRINHPGSSILRWNQPDLEARRNLR